MLSTREGAPEGRSGCQHRPRRKGAAVASIDRDRTDLWYKLHKMYQSRSMRTTAAPRRRALSHADVGTVPHRAGVAHLRGAVPPHTGWVRHDWAARPHRRVYPGRGTFGRRVPTDGCKAEAFACVDRDHPIHEICTIDRLGAVHESKCFGPTVYDDATTRRHDDTTT